MVNVYDIEIAALNADIGRMRMDVGGETGRSKLTKALKLLSTIQSYNRLRYDRLCDHVASGPTAGPSVQADDAACAGAADEIIEACHRAYEEYGKIAATVKPSTTKLRASSETEGTSGQAIENSEAKCPICLDTLQEPQAVRCGHVFCASCLRPCRTCPLCRTRIDDSYHAIGVRGNGFNSSRRRNLNMFEDNE